jgi:hypothetical protein
LIATTMLGCNKKADTAVEKAALETGIEALYLPHAVADAAAFGIRM